MFKFNALAEALKRHQEKSSLMKKDMADGNGNNPKHELFAVPEDTRGDNMNFAPSVRKPAHGLLKRRKSIS